MITLNAIVSTPGSLTPAHAWQMVAEQLQMQMSRETFNSYIRTTAVIDFDGEALSISTPSPFARDWLASRLTSTVRGQLAPLFGRPVDVRFVYQEPAVPPREPAPPQPLAGDSTAAPASSTRAPKSVVERKAERIPEPEAGGEGEGALSQANDSQAEALAAEAGQAEDGQDETGQDGCRFISIEEVAGTVEAALQQPGKIVAFPRYELRHIALVGAEAFFLRLAFLQERFLHTTPDGRGKPFVTTVDALLRWANVGRATLHRFKKGDPARGQQPAAGWFGIEQMPFLPRSGEARSGAPQRQPPCRYRIQQGIPLTPMDADRLHNLLIAAGIQNDPLAALQSLHSRPIQDILQFPPPAPTEEQRKRPPAFTTVAGVVQAALGNRRIEPDQRQAVQEWTAKLADHITMPQQMVHVSWYFLQAWLPILGHDAAAFILYTRALGYYNPQDQELRDEIRITGGYSELARAVGLKRDRTIGDWLPNIFDRRADSPRQTDRRRQTREAGETEKWQREQQRQGQVQDLIGQFVQVVPGSRRKMEGGHYAFNLRVAIKAEPLTPPDQCARDWVYQALAACAEQNVLAHFHAWVTSPVLLELAHADDLAPAGAGQNDGAGILANKTGANHGVQNDGRGTLARGGEGYHQAQMDGWGILAAREMTGGESDSLDNDGWGILESILNDGAGILTRFEMTAGELFKILLKLNTYWESILQQVNTTTQQAEKSAVVGSGSDLRAGRDLSRGWDLSRLCSRNGGTNRFRDQIIAQESTAQPFLSWLCYAYSFKGRGIEDPVGWALSRLKDQPGVPAEGIFADLAAYEPEKFARLLDSHIDSGQPPADDNWRLAFHDTPPEKLRALADTLGER